MNVNRLTFVVYLGLLSACSTPYRVSKTQVTNIRVQADSLQLYDTATANMIAPYKQQLDAQMKEVIGVADQTLTKELPDGCLGNMVADACLSYAVKVYPQQVDFCILNNGGIRIPSIQQGSITVEKIYELMPFDNMVEVVEISGEKCLELFTWIAKNKGVSVSGVQLTLNQGNPTEITIQGVPFNSKKTYHVATTDFLSNGGDGLTMLADGKRFTTNYKLRDAIIAYIKSNQHLKANNNGRIKQN